MDGEQARLHICAPYFDLPLTHTHIFQLQTNCTLSQPPPFSLTPLRRLSSSSWSRALTQRGLSAHSSSSIFLLKNPPSTFTPTHPLPLYYQTLSPMILFSGSERLLVLVESPSQPLKRCWKVPWRLKKESSGGNTCRTCTCVESQNYIYWYILNKMFNR